MASSSKTLYTGVTRNLEKRVYEHKKSVKDKKKGCVRGLSLSFAARYNIDKLVYFEEYSSPDDAIAREKEIKGWVRKKKLKLIMENNPEFDNLSEAWSS